MYFCIFVHRYLAARGYRGIIITIDGWGLNGYCFRFLPLAILFPLFINWFDLLTGLDTAPESPMLSENHFSRGSFKSHSVWLAKITFFTGPECAGGRGRRSEVCSCSKKVYELQIFDFLGWKVSRSRLSTLVFFDLKMCKIIAFCSDFRGKYSRFDYQLMIIGNWSQVWCRLWIIILLHLRGSPPVRDH